MFNPSKYLGTSVSNNLKLGIVGTTNCGKSSLFNTLMAYDQSLYCETKDELFTATAIVEDSIFTTIDPNISIFHPPDSKYGIKFSKYIYGSIFSVVIYIIRLAL
jgi:ribosome-binding ATPase YchF (GTP1/OBG family)